MISQKTAFFALFAALALFLYFLFNYLDVSGFLQKFFIKSATSEPSDPVELVIPAINVSAKVESIGLAKDGSVGAPAGPFNVAWFNLGPKPGQKGSAVISGHFGKWKDGSGSVFDNLNKLKEGDRIYVKDAEGKTVAFIVDKIKLYGKDENAPEIFSNSPEPRLNLITCAGDWLKQEKTYGQRLVVFSKKIP